MALITPTPLDPESVNFETLKSSPPETCRTCRQVAPYRYGRRSHSEARGASGAHRAKVLICLRRSTRFVKFRWVFGFLGALRLRFKGCLGLLAVVTHLESLYKTRLEAYKGTLETQRKQNGMLKP